MGAEALKPNTAETREVLAAFCEMYPQAQGHALLPLIERDCAFIESLPEPSLDGKPFPGKQRTSKAAAKKIEPKVNSLRYKVLDVFHYDQNNHPDDPGLTDSDLFTEYFHDKSPNSVRPRRVELVDQGWIKDSGKTRKNANGNDEIVWVLA